MKKLLIALLQVMILSGLILALTPAEKGRAALPPPPAYLPLIDRPPITVSGRITFWGEAISSDTGVYLDLSCGSFYAHAVPDANGYYSVPLPDAEADSTCHMYYYHNESIHPDGRIHYWSSGPVYPCLDPLSSTPVNVELADVFPLTPVTDSTVILPVTFHWQKVPGYPDASYQMYFIGWYGLGDYTTPWLGDVDSYTMNLLPEGILPDHLYVWSLYVKGSDGSFGWGFYHANIFFSNTGSVLSDIPLSR